MCVCVCVRFLQCQRKWKWNGKRVARWTPDVRQGGVYPAGKRDSILPSGGVHSQSEAPSWVCPAPQMLPQRMLSNGFRQCLHALKEENQNSIHQTSNFRQTLGCVFPLLELPLFVILTIFDSSAMKQNNSTSCDSLFTTIFQIYISTTMIHWKRKEIISLTTCNCVCPSCCFRWTGLQAEHNIPSTKLHDTQYSTGSTG